MYGPLFKPLATTRRFTGLRPPHLQSLLPPPAGESPSDHQSAHNRAFLRRLNKGLQAIMPSIARRWATTSDARYGMLVCDIYLVSYVDGRDRSPPLCAAPTLTVIFHPSHECPTKVNACDAAPHKYSEAQALANKLQAFLDGTESQTEAATTSPASP